jgi:hypothetical protein
LPNISKYNIVQRKDLLNKKIMAVEIKILGTEIISGIDSKNIMCCSIKKMCFNEFKIKNI